MRVRLKPSSVRQWIEARWHYLTPRAKDCDVVVTNTFAKANEGEGGIITGFPSVKSSGGDLVLICSAPKATWLTISSATGGIISSDDFRLTVRLPPQVERLIVFNEYKDLTAAGFFAPSERVLMLDRWDDVLRVLGEKHGDRAKVAIYSSAEIQYCDDSGGDPSGDR